MDISLNEYYNYHSVWAGNFTLLVFFSWICEVAKNKMCKMCSGFQLVGNGGNMKSWAF